MTIIPARLASFTFITALILVTAGCASAGPDGRMLDVAAAPDAVAARESESRSGPQFPDRLIVYAGDIAIEVSSLADIEPKILAIAKESKGFVARSRMEEDAYTISLRVPAQDLNSVMNKLAGLGNLVRRNVQTEDVTNQHIDYAARLKNLEVLRNQLRDLLARAKSVKETLEVEQELSRVQGQIDSLRGQLDALNDRIAYSTLEVRVTPTRIYGPVGYVLRGVSWLVEKLFVIR